MNTNTKKALLELKERCITLLFFMPVLAFLYISRNSVGLTGITMFFLGIASADRSPYSKERELKLRGDLLAVSVPVWGIILLIQFL